MTLEDTTVVDDQIEALGCGRYQILLLLAVGSSFLVESLEMGVVSPLHTALGHVYSLSRGERVGLAALTYAGSMGGMFIAGPLADCWGRKKGLLLALCLIFISSVLHAVVPLNSPTSVLLFLRVLGGIGGAITLPTGYTLAAESTPESMRFRIVFGISFLGSLGYFLEAVGIQWFMPHFGEHDSDNWRGLCLFIGLPALIAGPLVWMVSESPAFLSTNGRWEECARSLQTIARWNGREDAARAITADDLRPTIVGEPSESSPTAQWPPLNSLAAHYLPILVVLALMDACKSFFTSGSAYLCKDLFELTRASQTMSPTALNIVASASPLVGMLLGERCVWAGVRTLMFGWSIVAAGSLFVLADSRSREVPWLVLLMVIFYKLAYGPMGTCLSMMKVQAFPTEFRGSAFASICVAGRLLCALGPMLLEGLKPQEDASSWNPRHLDIFIIALGVTALCAGLLVFPIPRACRSQPVLRSLSSVNLCSEDEGGLTRSASASDYSTFAKRKSPSGGKWPSSSRATHP